MPRTQVDGFQVLDDSITGDDVAEETLVDYKIPFVEPEFVASNIHDAIVESHSNPVLYGFIDRDITVPSSKAMVMVNPIIGDNEIIIEGELVIL